MAPLSTEAIRATEEAIQRLADHGYAPVRATAGPVQNRVSVVCRDLDALKRALMGFRFSCTVSGRVVHLIFFGTL